MTESGAETSPDSCPECGGTIPAGAPLGRCPVCLLGIGGDSGSVTGDTSPDGDSEQLVPGYRITGKLGEGGFAVVYEAEREGGVRRKVALKVLRAELVSPRVLARFEAERQALALMDHPDIATVYEAGESPDGIPYVAMELIDGLPLTDYISRKQLGRRERLVLLRRICDAVQHAHWKGVIHRDLKPSNILVTEIDGRPEPRVIDFGIARAVDVSLTDRTLYTDWHQLLGTPGYMSPE